MTDRSLQSELLGLLGRFLLFLAVLVLTFPTGLSMLLRLAAPRLASGDATGAGAGDRSIEIISPLDGFTGPPKPITRPDEPPEPDDSWVRPGEWLIVAPNAPEGSWPMVEGKDGLLYQLTPGGRRLLSNTELGEVHELLWRGGLVRRPYEPEVDGKRPRSAFVPVEGPAPDAVTHPTVRLPDGRKVRLGPDGQMTPVP